MFQFTRPRGARLAAWFEGNIKSAIVSIHAPARGATVSFRRPKPSADGFNSRAREGRDTVESP